MKSEQEASSAWELFANRCRKSKYLQHPVLYALPKRFVEILQEAVPDLLTKPDVAFEHRLREFGGTGFVHQRPTFSNVLDRAYRFSKNTADPTLEYCPNLAEFSSEFFCELPGQLSTSFAPHVQDALSISRFDEAALKREREVKRRIEQAVQLRLRAYAAWLVTQSDFWIDVVRLRALHGGQRVLLEHLPGSAMRGRSPNRRSPSWPQYCLESEHLLQKWALSRMTTLHLPEPLEPGLFVGATVPQNGFGATGASMHLPWSLMADQTFQFRELADFYRQRNDLIHLDGWLNREKNWGPKRYSRMLDIYVYLELALTKRYPERVKDRIEQIDLAFASYWQTETTGSSEDQRANAERGLDTVKDIRQKLYRRLKACRQKLNDDVTEVISGQQQADCQFPIEDDFTWPDPL